MKSVHKIVTNVGRVNEQYCLMVSSSASGGKKAMRYLKRLVIVERNTGHAYFAYFSLYMYRYGWDSNLGGNV